MGSVNSRTPRQRITGSVVPLTGIVEVGPTIRKPVSPKTNINIELSRTSKYCDRVNRSGGAEDGLKSGGNDEEALFDAETTRRSPRREVQGDVRVGAGGGTCWWSSKRGKFDS